MNVHSWSYVAYLENSSAQTETVFYNCCAHTLKLIKGSYLHQTYAWELPGHFLKIPLKERGKEGLDSK